MLKASLGCLRRPYHKTKSINATDEPYTKWHFCQVESTCSAVSFTVIFKVVVPPPLILAMLRVTYNLAYPRQVVYHLSAFKMLVKHGRYPAGKSAVNEEVRDRNSVVRQPSPSCLSVTPTVP